MSETGKRIKKRRKELDISADFLAERLGISRSTIFRYEKGEIEKVPALLLNDIAKILKTTPGYLMGWENTPEAGPSENQILNYENIYPVQKRSFPMLGEIACGQPILANETFDTYISTDMDISADFCLTARGDSMINARIFDGDVVFIRRQDVVENGEIAAVAIDDEVTLKRVFYYPEDQAIRLQAENPQYAPKTYSGEELDHIHILGKAVFFQSIVR